MFASWTFCVILFIFIKTLTLRSMTRAGIQGGGVQTSPLVKYYPLKRSLDYGADGGEASVLDRVAKVASGHHKGDSSGAREALQF